MEYKILELVTQLTERDLENAYEDMRWELVSVVLEPGIQNADCRWFYFFKRSKKTA